MVIFFDDEMSREGVMNRRKKEKISVNVGLLLSRNGKTIEEKSREEGEKTTVGHF